MRVLDELNAAALGELRDLYARREPESRAVSDLAVIARAATFGAVDTLFVDIDAAVPGSIDAETGVLELSAADDASNYGVVDELARRGGSVLAVRRDDVPGRGSAAAILRYALAS